MQKQVTIVCILISLIQGFSYNVFAQEFIGLRTDNYSGSNGMLLNPAAPLAGKLEWDLNILTIGINEDNNYISLPDPMLKFISTSDSLLNVSYYNPEKIYAHGNVLFQLPSAFFKFKDYAVGLFFNIRTAGYFLSEIDTAGITGLKGIPLYTPTNMPAFTSGALIWGEAGINGEITLARNSVYSLYLGANIKYLSGFEALSFENNSTFNFTKDTVNFTISHFDTNYDYTRNLGSNLLFDPQNYAINGSGLGIDAGIYYTLHKKSKFKFSRELDYTWKLGFSLVDFGSIKFKSNSGTYHLLNEQPFVVGNIVLDSIDDIDEFNRTGSRTIYDFNTASQDGSRFGMMLPAAIVVSAERALPIDFYVSLLYVQRIPRFNTNLIARANILALTPRYESRMLSVALPLVLYEGKEFRFGAAARFMFFTIGSDNLRTWMDPTDYSSLDMYVGIKLNPYWLVPKPKTKFLDCLKM